MRGRSSGSHSFLARSVVLGILAVPAFACVGLDEPEGDEVSSTQDMLASLPASWGYYRLRLPLLTNSCMDVYGAGKNDGTNIIEWQCHGGKNQIFRLETTAAGYYRLVASHSGKCVDVSGNGTADGTNIQLWSCNGSSAQDFRVESSNGAYRLVGRNSGKCIDVAGASSTDGTNVLLWSCHGGKNQTWSLEPVACFAAYTDADYRGAESVFCEGASNTFVNDSYSSLRVPKGVWVRGYEHGNGSGIGRTYFSDAHWVGSDYNDKFSKFDWGTFSDNDLFMFFVSDPQLDWTHCQDNPSSADCETEKRLYGTDKETIGWDYNKRLVAAMHRVQSYLGNRRVGGLIVNGDLTEFGRHISAEEGAWDDLDEYKELYADYRHESGYGEVGLNMNVYHGLGNHDYVNAIDDCFFPYSNYCSSHMVWFLANQVGTLNPLRFDYSSSTSTSWDWSTWAYWNYQKNQGSLGYSFEVGNIHFVQLNDNPTYARSWKSTNWWDYEEYSFNISKALDWLKADLADARARGQKIVLNLHDLTAQCEKYGCNAADFASLVNDPASRVSAVYAGHHHRIFGYPSEGSWYKAGISIPVLYSGSPHVGTFLLTRFQGDRMRTWVMKVDQLGDKKLKVRKSGAWVDVDTLGLPAIFDGSTAYYDYDSPLK
ncbi:MAG: RICIN domain-containing protein [Deltaproteobacteria bacterium]|nr:RICIN domain-containing protein [Deltaproteobacteria bacterium]